MCLKSIIGTGSTNVKLFPWLGLPTDLMCVVDPSSTREHIRIFIQSVTLHVGTLRLCVLDTLFTRWHILTPLIR
jgi:hypothetical protein